MPPTVMLVIQDLQFMRVLNWKLHQLGMDVESAENSSDCLEILDSSEIDVVLLDIRFHGEETLQQLENVKKISPATEVILLSNQDSISWAMEGIQAGAFDDIPEPFDMDLLVSKIRAAWMRKRVKKHGGVEL